MADAYPIFPTNYDIDKQKQLVKGTVKSRTLLATGALGQVLLLQFLPTRLAILPAALFSLHSIVTTVAQIIRGDLKNTIIPGRSTAQLPHRESGAYGTDPAAEPIVVFHFGVRFSHPLGLLSPGGREINEHFQKCLELVQAEADSYGLLGFSDWRGADTETNNTILLVFYFRNVEGLHRFAHGKVHRDAWDWTVKAGHKHIGFFHETFCVPRKAYESIYVNMPPTLFGRSSVMCRDDGEGEQVVSTLVSADGLLNTMVRRLGYNSEKELGGE